MLKAEETISAAGVASFDVVKGAWDAWRRDKTHITAKLYKSYIRKADWFLTTHAASEAALRRLIFIGFRMKHVPYAAAQAWMDGHSITYGKKHGEGTFIVIFDDLYARNWADTMKATQGLEELWELWNDFAKPVRNGLAHGARKYPDDWLDAALSIDRLFMMRIDDVMSPVIGGTPFADLRLLSPRLGIGNPGVTPESTLSRRAKRARAGLPIEDAAKRLGALVNPKSGEVPSGT